MTRPAAANYRNIGDTTFDVWESEFRRVNSPLLLQIDDMYAAAKPHSALCLAQMWIENQYATTGHIIKAKDNNPLSLRPWDDDPRGLPHGTTRIITAPGGGKFLAFLTAADCIREWKRRLFDDPGYKGGVYTGTVSLKQMLDTYAPPGDVHPVTGIDNADISYATGVQTMLNKFTAMEHLEGAGTVAKRFAVSMGHRNENRGGARNEINWTPECARAIVAELKSRGAEAYLVQEHDGDSDPNFSVGKGLQQAASAGMANIAKKYGTIDAYISCHYNGGASPGFHVIFPDGTGDTKAINTKDVRVCRFIRDRIKKTGTVGLLSWTADSPGVMSEKETGVGAQGYRLGEMVATKPYRETTVRIILEAGSIDVARERAFINDPNWVRNVYAKAVIDGIQDEFGQLGTAPKPQPDPDPKPDYLPTIALPALDVFKERPESQVPSYVVDDDGKMWSTVMREMHVTEATGRFQTDELTGAVGADMQPGDPAYIMFQREVNGKMVGYSNWATRFDLSKTDGGVAQ